MGGKVTDFRRFRRGGGSPPPATAPGVLPDAGPPPVFNPTAENRLRIFFGVPTVSGKVNWSIAHQMGKMMAYSRDPSSPIEFATSFIVGQRPVEYARNNLVKQFLTQTDAHWLMMVDDDQVMPENFWELVRVPVDVVSGTTNVWVGNGYLPGRLRVNQYGLNEKAQCFNLTPPDEPPGPYLVPIVGTGCVAIRRRVFEKLGDHPFRFTYDEYGKMIAGEDVNFCMDTLKAGFKIAVHPTVKFGHVKEIDLAQIGEFEKASREFHAAGREHLPNDMLSVAV